MSVTLGVSLTRTGTAVFSITHSVIIWTYSGTWPTAAPMPRSLIPCGQPKLSSMPSAPVSLTRLTMSYQVWALDSTISETTTAWLGYRFLTSATSARLASIERSLISSMLDRPTMRRPPISSEPSLEVTLVIGSPTVFQTTPPHPASNARATISPVFVIGQEASQNGFGPRMPAMSVKRSTPGTVESEGRTRAMRGAPRASMMDAAASLAGLDGVDDFGPAIGDVADGPDLGVGRPAGHRVGEGQVAVRGDPEGGQEARRRALAHRPDDRVERPIEA